MIASSLGIFDSIPWALVLYPGILSIRGAIGGLYAGRLSTALHLGTIKPSLFNNTREAYVLFNTVNALTLLSALLMGSVGSVVAILVTNAPITDLFMILMTIIASMGLSILFISPFTFWVSVQSFKRGFDPDVLVYPVVSTVADLVITALYLGVLMIGLTFMTTSWILLTVFNAIFVVGILFSIRKIYKDPEFITTVKEFVVTLFFVSIIVNITGTALASITETIGKRKELFMIYPALIDTVGDVGSITGSTATTKMALGMLGTRFSEIRNHSNEIISAWTASLVMFSLYSITSSIVYGIDKLPQLLIDSLATNILVVPIIVVVSFFTAIVTRKRGLDPDNFIIPIETSISDGLTTIGLLVVLILTR